MSLEKYSKHKEVTLECPHCKQNFVVNEELDKRLGRELWIDSNKEVISGWPLYEKKKLPDNMKHLLQPRTDITVECLNCGGNFNLTHQQKLYLSDVGYHNTMVSLINRCKKEGV